MVTDHSKKTYGPVGRCIYCGSTKELQREHIVPFSIGGNHQILPKSSCADCAKITHDFETVCVQKAYGVMRDQFQFPSRSKIRSKQVGVTKTPGPFRPFAVPVYDFPGLLCEQPKAPLPSEIDFMTIIPLLSGTPPPPVSTYQTDAYAFARMLAKIGYGFAVAQYGIDRIAPDLVPYILGTDQDIAYVVGKSDRPFPPVEQPLRTDSHGNLTIEPFLLESMIYDYNGRRLLVIRIQLFRFMNAPTHNVVVCHANNDLISLVLGPDHPLIR